MIKSDKYTINRYIKGTDVIPDKFINNCKGIPDGYRITIAELNIYSYSIEDHEEVEAQKHCAYPEHKEQRIRKSLYYTMFDKMYGDLREKTNKAYINLLAYLNITQINNKMLNDCSNGLNDLRTMLMEWKK